ncbi:MAG: DNA polymerase III subunit chi [Alphaproteobacteria bacterium]|nr:DNA polymerase III subunit chi [Alphaproteobacteria bacterium]
MEINFYGVLQEDVAKVACVLLEKAYKANSNSVLLAANTEEARNFDAKLWSSISWLPHCMAGEAREQETPLVIYDLNLSQDISVKNQAKLCFILGETPYNNLEKFEKAYIIFDLRDSNALKANRERWKTLVQKDYMMRFYKQNQQGKFEETKIG